MKRRPTMEALHLLQFPTEILKNIVCFVPEENFSSLALTCSRFLSIFRQQRFQSIFLSSRVLDLLSHHADPYDYVQKISVTGILEPDLPRIKDVLSRVPKLRYLEWRRPVLCEDLLKFVARSPIEHLHLCVEEIPKTPARLDAWSLRVLHIAPPPASLRITPKPMGSILPILRRCAGIMQTLSIPVSDDCLEIAGHITSLTNFRVTAPASLDLLQKFIEILPRDLMCLDIAFVGSVSMPLIKAITKLQSLQSIQLRGNGGPVDHSVISELSPLKSLRKLDVSGFSTGLQYLSRMQVERGRKRGDFARKMAPESKKYEKISSLQLLNFHGVVRLHGNRQKTYEARFQRVTGSFVLEKDVQLES